ncbi:MAG TPA: phage/plasmid primase, P4 family [Spirochaetota bacterium]|nr:phage/plasmid primase, P4 family [Spirochaetota bacterium]HPP18529.1 phage/plasmid primase, P4 family [Candidatus Dojkabacteria bacterium]
MKQSIDNFETKKRNALLYAQNNMKLIPLHGVIFDDADHKARCTCKGPECTKQGKHPRITNWQQQASNDQEKILSWFKKWPDMNFGVITGNGIFVLDIDNRNNGFESLENLQSQYGALPETLTVNTGDGMHLYYRYNSKIYKVPGKMEHFNGIDVRGDGCYVIGAGSMHKSGKIYQFGQNCPSNEQFNIAEAPDWLLCHIADRVTEEMNEEMDTGVLPFCDKLDREYIPEGKRNETLTSLAGHLWNKGLSTDDIENRLLLTNYDLCLPSLTDNEVKAVVKSISKYPRHNEYPLTDLGNSERFIDRYQNIVRFCKEQKAWYIWNGSKWNIDKKNEIQELAKDMAMEMKTEAYKLSDPEIRNALLQHAKKSQSNASIKNIINLSESDRSINVTGEDLDSNNWLFNVANGTLDLKTGLLLPHDPSDLITKISNVKYDETARCPKFMAFLDYILAGNDELIEYIQKLVGYCLTGSIDQQILPILYGTGSNGKTTFMKVLEGLLGEYCIYSDISSFVASQNSSTRNDLARMKGSRLVLTTEFEHNQNISEALIKKVTGGEKITCRFLYGEYFDYTPTFKIMMATNYKPRVKGTDEGIWRRIHLIPFTVRITEENRKENYAQELLEELSGILNWAIEGCLKWQSDKLKKPAAVEEATSDYRMEMDDLADFLDACCETADNSKTRSSELFDAYIRWCYKNDIKDQLTQKAFSKELEERGYRKKRDSMGTYWKNIVLKEDSSTEDFNFEDGETNFDFFD